LVLMSTQQKFMSQFPEKKGFLRYKGSTPQFYNYLKWKNSFSWAWSEVLKDEMFLKIQKRKFDELYSEVYKKPKSMG
jgi:hypothetical protein